MRQDELRPALYHRFHFLMPWLSHPRVRIVWKFAVRLFWLLYFSFVLLVLALRYLVLPNVENYRPDIEREISRSLGLAVAIGNIKASWDGINPVLVMTGVGVADAEGNPALAFTRVRSVLAWSSLTRWQLRLSLLQIDEPTLHLRRDTEGHLFIAGLGVGRDGDDHRVADWILAQKRIRIHGATLIWDDAQRNAPTLILQDLRFALDNDGRQHRFGLTARPPADLAAPIDLRGEVRGRDIEHFAAWKGQIFAQVDYVDLAAWQTWLDYPLTLPQGRGALRAWVGFADGALSELTSDLALADVKLRFTDKLPALDLERFSGRLRSRFQTSGVSIDGQDIELATPTPANTRGASPQGIRIAPTDFHVDWQRQANGSTLRGGATASVLDLGALTDLAEYLPLDASSRRQIAEYAPRGQVRDLRATWQGTAEHLQSYAFKGRFERLVLKAKESFPGVSGLSGSLEANERGGNVTLLSQKLTIDLPKVFPESSIPLDTLSAQAKWKIGKDGRIDVELAQAEFAGPEAAGSAQGRYRYGQDGPGSIDLTAALTRADARAVWRYLPHTVNATARQWLRDALQAGSASEAKLVLKGDLQHFPFTDHKEGQFLVTVKAQNVTLDYGTGWPTISGIDADLRFEGPGMLVQAKRGAILGTRLSQTRAEIPDFAAPLTLLKVKGRAEGETAEFLKFIKQSPVAAQIDHFTQEMGAVGKGQLDIGLVVPLDATRLGETKVEGNYVFQNNEVSVDSALPPLRQVNGSLQFTEKDLRLGDINATLLGGALKVGGGVQNGRVQITANGTVAVDELKRRMEWPPLDNISGTATYRAEVRVRKRNVELQVDSNLVGVTSTLEAPFGKSAAEALPLHLESVALPAVSARNAPATPREQFRATLGNVASLQMIRRRQADERSVERGALTIGRPLLPMPERGFSVAVSAKVVDLDYWQHALRSADKDGASAAGANLPITIDLKADELIAFDKHYTEVTAGLTGASPHWRGALQSREALGSFQWDSSGAGKLTARLKRWRRPDKESKDARAGEVLKELPVLDIVVEDFTIGDHRFGRLDVQAHNDGGIWRLDRIELGNPQGSLSGNGQWQFGNGNRTQLDFTLDSSDVGRLLEQLGYPGIVRGGVTTLKGKIGWHGTPAALDFATLSGDMALEGGKGQFLKLDPGAGKLLGLISLQGLPRRFLLDFGDVFSDGFAFDRIAGKMTVKGGLMHTDRLQIDGPSARVMIRGDADLKHETQRLNVTVQPEIGGSAALGIAVVHPLVGVATLLAHRVLQNPLNKVFAFDYLVTGKWDDPKVERLAGPVAASASGTVP